MPSLTIRDIPEPVWARLKARAAHANRSLNGEIKQILAEAVQANESPRRFGEALAVARRQSTLRLSVEDIVRTIAEGRNERDLALD